VFRRSSGAQAGVMTALGGRLDGFVVALRNPQYRVFTMGSLVATIGTWVQRVAVGWLAWELTHSETWLGILAFADLFPVLVAGPFAGALADRLDRLKGARLLQALVIVQSIALTVLTYTGQMTIELLVGLTFILGIIGTANQPFRTAIIGDLVTRSELPAAIAINSMTWHGSRFIGPAIAGATILYAGVVPAFLANAVTHVALIVALYRIHVPPPAGEARSYRELPKEIAEGFRYAVSHPVIGPALFILFCSSFFGRPVMEFLPAFADAVFHRGAGGLAWLTSAGGLGALFSGVWLASRRELTGLVAAMVANLAILAVALMAFVASDVFWIGVVAIVPAGFAIVVGGITIQTLIQSAVERQLRGRVLSTYGLVWLGGPALGSLLVGAASELVSLRVLIAGGAAMCLVAWAWGLTRRHKIDAEFARSQE
jgi:MFS family permease